MYYYCDMGIVPQPETKRDKKLIKDYLLQNRDGSWKYSISQLGVRYARVQDGKEYPLTPARIYQILNKHGVAKKRVPARK
jgi:hypothetical protein